MISCNPGFCPLSHIATVIFPPSALFCELSAAADDLSAPPVDPPQAAKDNTIIDDNAKPSNFFLIILSPPLNFMVL